MKNKKPNILFLCRANIGRSQMANKLYNKLTNKESIGAGTKVKPERQNMTIGKISGAENMIPCMQEEGINIKNSKIKQVTKSMTNWADKIIIMTSKENLPNFIFSKENRPKLIFWDVKDPKGTDLNGHRKTRDKIKKLIETELI